VAYRPPGSYPATAFEEIGRIRNEKSAWVRGSVSHASVGRVTRSPFLCPSFHSGPSLAWRACWLNRRGQGESELTGREGKLPATEERLSLPTALRKHPKDRQQHLDLFSDAVQSGEALQWLDLRHGGRILQLVDQNRCLNILNFKDCQTGCRGVCSLACHRGGSGARHL
jgi:hypothetical protein